MTTLAAAIAAQAPRSNEIPSQNAEARIKGATSGIPNLILRLEAAAAMAVSLAAYQWEGQGWLLFAVLFLVPDLSMLGYLGGRRLGAATYNAAHSYLLPIALGAAGLGLSRPLLIAIALTWVAHIAFDRLLGFGLKYQSAFGHTHLGVSAKAKAGD